jgi:hypothetical protein
VDRNEILEHLRARIVRFAASRLVGGAADGSAGDTPEDIAQEVLLVLHEKYPALNRAEDLVPLAIEIARFKILAARRKTVWVLDRPNPIGRPVEGLTLRPGQESFVGAGPLPMRHGLTMGELGRWFVRTLGLDIEYEVVPMDGWRPDEAPGFGWPPGERAWVNPSPNIPSPWTARPYPGTVLLEGTTLSEGRGTTRPLEM